MYLLLSAVIGIVFPIFLLTLFYKLKKRVFVSSIICITIALVIQLMGLIPMFGLEILKANIIEFGLIIFFILSLILLSFKLGVSCRKKNIQNKEGEER